MRPCPQEDQSEVGTDTLSSQLYVVVEKYIRGLTLERDCLSLNLGPSPFWL